MLQNPETKKKTNNATMNCLFPQTVILLAKSGTITISYRVRDPRDFSKRPRHTSRYCKI
jgi:hypothetical protein